MGFFRKLFNNIVENTSEDLRDIQQYREVFENYSDDKLITLYKRIRGSSSSIDRKKRIACTMILKERGIIE